MAQKLRGSFTPKTTDTVSEVTVALCLLTGTEIPVSCPFLLFVELSLTGTVISVGSSLRSCGLWHWLRSSSVVDQLRYLAWLSAPIPPFLGLVPNPGRTWTGCCALSCRIGNLWFLALKQSIWKGEKRHQYL